VAARTCGRCEVPDDRRRACEEVTRLLAENRRLRELLTEHGIAWQPRDITPTTDRSPRLGTDEKVKLFASLFRGRDDVYPVPDNRGTAEAEVSHQRVPRLGFAQNESGACTHLPDR
jgi:hypothetical protein